MSFILSLSSEKEIFVLETTFTPEGFVVGTVLTLLVIYGAWLVLRQKRR